MKKSNNLFVNVFLWTTPVGVFCLTADLFPVLRQVLQIPILGTLLTVIFGVWFISCINVFALLLFSSETRELLFSKVFNIRERDEREQHIVAEATRFNFFFILAILSFLFAMSTSRYGVGLGPADQPRYTSFTIGHWDFIEPPVYAEKEVDGKLQKITHGAIPLTKSGILLLLIFLHLSSFAFGLRKKSKQ